jgi:hypothetical protein
MSLGMHIYMYVLWYAMITTPVAKGGLDGPTHSEARQAGAAGSAVEPHE